MSEDLPRRSILEIDALPGPQTTLTLAGELDPGTAPVLADRLAALAADGSVERVVIDLARVTFLDSSGVRALVTGNEALHSRSAALALRAPNANVLRVLQVTGLTQLLEVE